MLAADRRTPGRRVRLHGRILLAEDGEDNQRADLARYLRKAGAEVVIAGNGRIAVDAGDDRSSRST